MSSIKLEKSYCIYCKSELESDNDLDYHKKCKSELEEYSNFPHFDITEIGEKFSIIKSMTIKGTDVELIINPYNTIGIVKEDFLELSKNNGYVVEKIKYFEIKYGILGKLSFDNNYKINNNLLFDMEILDYFGKENILKYGSIYYDTDLKQGYLSIQINSEYYIIISQVKET